MIRRHVGNDFGACWGNTYALEMLRGHCYKPEIPVRTGTPVKQNEHRLLRIRGFDTARKEPDADEFCNAND